MLVAQNQTMTACGVPPAPAYQMMQWFRELLFGVQSFFVILKVANKLMKLSPWGWDDLSILIAYALLTAFFPLSYLPESSGAGRDIWTLTPDEITERLISFFICSLLYMNCLASIKASILFLYLRIFPDQRFRRILWGTQLFNLLVGISFTAATLAGCRPINFFWNGWWTGQTGDKCIDLNAFAICNGAFNLALDVWMLALPASQVYNLRMEWKKKAGVMLMFSVGICLTAISAYRIKVLMDFATSLNITGNSFLTSLYSHIELCVGIFVACLPSVRQLWSALSPKITGATRLSSRLFHSSKASHDASQDSQATSGAHGPPTVAVYNEASIAHLLGDFKRIDLNNLPEPSPTEAECPQTPDKCTDTSTESSPSSSRRGRSLG
ncbi:integral membrane protein [Colletotrichum caudatum]|nr:integral membrane protein [Colletotrichum caudatum]